MVCVRTLKGCKLTLIPWLQGTVCMVCVGTEKGSGLFTLAGPQDIVAEMGPRLVKILAGLV